MLQNESNDNDRKEVKGDFPVSFHYTAGIAIEKVWKGFVDKKLLATKCNDCNYVYFPGKLFCEICFEELSEEDWLNLSNQGILMTYTEVNFDMEGKKLDTPIVMGLIKVDNADTYFLHRLIKSENGKNNNFKIGSIVKLEWNDDRKGSLDDIKGCIVI